MRRLFTTMILLVICMCSTVVYAKSYTSSERFQIQSFGGYTLSSNAKAKSKTCNYGYFKLTVDDSGSLDRYCIFVTTTDTSDPITYEQVLSHNTANETRVTYKPNYRDMNNKTIKCKVRGSNIEPAIQTYIWGKFSPEN